MQGRRGATGRVPTQPDDGWVRRASGGGASTAPPATASTTLSTISSLVRDRMLNAQHQRTKSTQLAREHPNHAGGLRLPA
eukprot:COSAG02_NODE_25607_length_653_cov_1.380866_1_plen_79_part_01